ncbi:MAG: HNH endonuclease [Chloroflexi bacterium]|nr:HNH endonuclease [Chloroflexota bacterium]
MIRLNQAAQPQILADNGETWTAEYVRWYVNPIGAAPRRYAHPQIRSALEAETASKCAYCEGRISDVAYTHIEHKRPKSKYPKLVCAWENLTIACPKCNTNKGDYDVPEYSLLDPYLDDVEEEVAFGGPLALPRGGARARATITLLDLNRKDLLFARGEVLTGLHRLLDLVERAGGEPDLQKSLWLDIEAATAAKGEFASACRQFLASQTAARGLTKP